MGKLICKSENGVEISFDINEKITVIGGYSASGKTYIINALKNAKKNSYNLYSNIDVSRYIIIDDELNISNVNNIKNDSIVFVDRYDSFSNESKQAIWDKMKKTSAIWVVMSRNPDFPNGLSCSIKSFKELTHSYGGKYIKFSLVDDKRLNNEIF